ncbi:MAG: hypothetical protein HKP40_07605 [Litoreibacter sp.]|nr:hypothetical protein [Litoreibacter sp.]
MSYRPLLLTLLAVLVGTSAFAQSADQLAQQREAYDAVRAKAVLDLQPFRNTMTAPLIEGSGEVTLTSLNPGVGAWFLLGVRSSADGATSEYHIENPDPATQTLSLSTGPDPALIIRRNRDVVRCAPWSDGAKALVAARETGLPYAPFCEETLFLRNKVRGSRTNLEAAAEFLRDNIWGGENIVRFVRDNFFKDSQLETSEALSTSGAKTRQDGPYAMRTDTPDDQRPVIGTLLDIALTGMPAGRMRMGDWHPVSNQPGVFASAFQPRAIAREVFESGGKTNRLDSVEAKATGYMIAFDLGQFDIGFALGTDHPALGWSPRPAAAARIRGLPGPDGIKKADPLVRLGMVNPVTANRTIATFTAGFKRQHGAFRFGDMATFKMGHHYGFIEKGVILSKLQPGLSTLFRLTDGTIEMKTWQEADNALLPQIQFARQNGVPLLETDPATGMGVPGDRVTQWGAGNWSGSADAKLRTLRAGACMAERDGSRYLLYGYFSTATPSAMARTFQAYGCSYAMLLDMNALEHTYLALYVPRGGQMHVAHLVPGMALVDKKLRDGTVIPRFIGSPDNRDLFYVTRKEVQE